MKTQANNDKKVGTMEPWRGKPLDEILNPR